MSRNEPIVEFLKDLRHVPWWISGFFGILVYLSITELLPRIVGESTMVALVVDKVRWLSLLFLVPAVISASRVLHGKFLLAANRAIEDIRSLHWQKFEELVEAYYRDHGFRTYRQLETGSDGGVDIRLSNNRGERYLVQCKQWLNQSIGVKIMKELYGIVAAEGATGGIAITSGSYTRGAREFAQGVSVALIDGRGLQQMLGDRVATVSDSSKSPTTSSPACPRCGSALVLRTARRGAHAGSEFHGCSSFPKCRSTQDLTH